jgi:hypothetical protein
MPVFQACEHKKEMTSFTNTIRDKKRCILSEKSVPPAFIHKAMGREQNTTVPNVLPPGLKRGGTIIKTPSNDQELLLV